MDPFAPQCVIFLYLSKLVSIFIPSVCRSFTTPSLYPSPGQSKKTYFFFYKFNDRQNVTNVERLFKKTLNVTRLTVRAETVQLHRMSLFELWVCQMSQEQLFS